MGCSWHHSCHPEGSAGQRQWPAHAAEARPGRSMAESTLKGFPPFAGDQWQNSLKHQPSD
eukprot:4305668-Karenia_brevis.AAC.2